MSVTRRQVLSGSAVGAVSLASGLAAPAIAQNEPIRIGYLPALTGPSSSTGIGINRGTVMAVEEINAAGGINGRKIELIVRDTQSDPTKAVNAVAELTQRQKVAIIWGPLNSGEALAATPLIARDKVPMLHPCWVDELIDVKKYPMSFRIAPTNTQVGAGANYYVVDVLKLKKVAVISDTTGYGTASVNTYVPMLKAKGAEVVYQNHIDAAPHSSPWSPREPVARRRGQPSAASLTASRLEASSARSTETTSVASSIQSGEPASASRVTGGPPSVGASLTAPSSA
jgi:branched-chain amino acid transport system substrate-binding protein